ncbi:TonB-dependent receptor [Sphingobacterium alkalisoli]|uniref:TonB-dependent receptor n=1 Tax=Sphingobacterium alkalisoli TaxID=1874115 RepID=A0A4U0H5Y3_9SPHI|nr:TonB-dependent receptor [Sphingobacterium alkalisoli]TJY67068.1 TonB-dependent receptor [Sphingobacterium alkalisoli]GGH12434.1 TonB-dependent receptor [Sphingobacterium alkalisoli]
MKKKLKTVRNLLFAATVFNVGIMPSTPAIGQTSKMLQEKQIYWAGSNGNLEQGLNQLEKQLDIPISYDKNLIHGKNAHTIKQSSTTASGVLNQLLTDNGLGYRIVQNNIVVVAASKSTKEDPTQKNIIAGYVKDANSGRVLPHSTLVNLSNNRETMADANGYFILQGLKPGKINIQVSYVGYQNQTIELTYPNGGTPINILLEPKDNNLEGITINGIRRGEALALSNMKNADNIRYVLSQEQIERFPDATVAEALQRVPGIAMDYSYGLPRNVVMRGLSQNMGSVTLNGTRLPSTQTNSREIDLNGILSSTVEAIEVNKTFTPDMDADATAGSVNIVSKTPKAGEELFRVNVGGGYNQLLSKANYNIGAVLGKRYDRWGFLADINYSQTYRGEDRVQVDYDTYEIDGQERLLMSNLELEGSDLERKNTGLQLELNYYPNQATKLYARSSYNKYFELQTRGTKSYNIGEYTDINQATDISIGSAGTPRDYNRDIITFSLGGKTVFNNYEVDADATFAKGRYDQPLYYDGYFQQSGLSAEIDNNDPSAPQFLFTGSDQNDAAKYTANSYNRRHQFAHDQDLQLSGNIKRSLSFGDGHTLDLKAGARFRYKEDAHTRNYFQYRLKTGSLTMDAFTSDYSRSEYFGGKYNLSGAIANGYLMEKYYQENMNLFETNDNYIRQNTDPDSYEGNENLAAGYFLGKLTTGRLETILGMRYERTGFKYTGNIVSFDDQGNYQSTQPVNTEAAFAGFFPSLNLKYKITEQTNIRGALTRTLSRPSYYDLVPWEEIEVRRKRMKKGNPQLDQSNSTNADLLFEHYLNPIGLLSGGIFYKRINDYIYESVYTQSGGTYDGYAITQTVNGAAADVYGLEIAWQQQFTFLPGFANGFGVFANYTYVKSSFEVPGVESVRKVRLPEMRPSVGNFALSYEKYGFSGRIALNFYETFISELADEEANDLMEKGRTQLDFSASQKINKNFTVFVGLSNITNSQVRFDFGDGRPNDYKYYARWGNIGVKYMIN